MILVDGSVWIDHLRRTDEILTDQLSRQQVLTHPLAIGELAIGNLQPRDVVLKELQELDRTIAARDDEVLRLIERERLFGIGLGYVDAHLLASVRPTPGTFPSTRDKRLSAAAERLSLAARVTHRTRFPVQPAAALISARRFAYSASRIAAIGATWPGSITSPAGGSSSAR